MQVFNSFQEMAAGQSGGAQSNMSVFNGATSPELGNKAQGLVSSMLDTRDALIHWLNRMRRRLKMRGETKHEPVVWCV